MCAAARRQEQAADESVNEQTGGERRLPLLCSSHKPGTRRAQRERSVLPTTPGEATHGRGSRERRRCHRIAPVSGAGVLGTPALPRRPPPTLRHDGRLRSRREGHLSVSLLRLQAAGAAGERGASGRKRLTREALTPGAGRVAPTGSGPASPLCREHPVPSPPRGVRLPAGQCGRGCTGQLVALTALVLPRAPAGTQADVTEQTRTSALGQLCGL